MWFGNSICSSLATNLLGNIDTYRYPSLHCFLLFTAKKWYSKVLGISPPLRIPPYWNSAWAAEVRTGSSGDQVKSYENIDELRFTKENPGLKPPENDSWHCRHHTFALPGAAPVLTVLCRPSNTILPKKNTKSQYVTKTGCCFCVGMKFQLFWFRFHPTENLSRDLGRSDRSGKGALNATSRDDDVQEACRKGVGSFRLVIVVIILWS
jgi:hypothetical protein